MTKTFKILPDLTCPELAGYKLPPVEPNRTPIAIEVEIIRVTLDGVVFPATNPDGTVKGIYIYE